VLDMGRYADCASSAEGSYALSAAIIHEGTLQSGHYFTAVKAQDAAEEPSWVLLNDQHVQAADEASILRVTGGIEAKTSSPLLDRYQVAKQFKSSATGYLLFYTRQQQQQ
jgi:hypothetical protein